jgi:hypothetical protein
MDESLPAWPEKGDQLFKAGEDWWLNAVIDHWNKDLHSYAEGYKQAAEILVERAIAASTGVRIPIDYLVFPIVFLYRQYIELRLKEIILLGNKLFDRPQGFPKIHEISKLWKSARAILEELKPKPSSEELDTVERCMDEFSRLDPESESFRYPVTKKGMKAFPQDQVVINLRQLREIMAKIASFLDAYSEGIGVLYEQKREIDDYYSP